MNNDINHNQQKMYVWIFGMLHASIYSCTFSFQYSTKKFEFTHSKIVFRTVVTKNNDLINIINIKQACIMNQKPAIYDSNS